MLARLIHVLVTLVRCLELAVFTVFLWLVSWLPDTGSGGLYRRLFRFWCRLFVDTLGVDLRLHQKNIHPLPAQYILVANHPSVFEDIGIPALFDVRCLAKAEVRHWWLVGRISAAAGTLFVRRQSQESRRQALEQMVRVLEAGDNIALYPEGGCRDKRLHERFYCGAFEASLRSGVPIVPVYLHYEAQNDFAWPDGVSLVEKIWDFMTTGNNRVHYYLYDAFRPADFADKEQYCRQVYDRYVSWQHRYLD